MNRLKGWLVIGIVSVVLLGQSGGTLGEETVVQENNEVLQQMVILVQQITALGRQMETTNSLIEDLRHV